MRTIKCCLLVAAVSCVATLFVVQKCGDSAYKRMRMQYNVYRAATQAILEESDRIIDEKNATIAEMDKEIIEATKVVGHMTNLIGVRDDRLTKLRAELAATTDKDAKIANLSEQVRIWAEKFDLAQKIVSEKDAQIGAWSMKFDAQVAISDEWRKSYEREHSLRLLCEGLVTAGERRFKKANTVKTLAITAVSGYVAYKLVRGAIK